MLSVGDGEVVVAKRSGAAGYYVAVRHGHTYTTRYMHLRKLLVKPGQKVKRGDRLRCRAHGRSTVRICIMKCGSTSRRSTANGETAAYGRAQRFRPYRLSGAGKTGDSAAAV